mgnify:CR=1 FL=1
MRDAVIVSTARTGIGRAYRGAFNATPSPTLAAHPIRAAVERAKVDPAEVDDVIMGAALQQGVQTTIGRTVYVTADWDHHDADQRSVTLRHEAVHLRQFRRFTLPGMAVLYLLVPLPMGLAWFRAHFEKQAYAESMK